MNRLRHLNIGEVQRFPDLAAGYYRRANGGVRRTRPANCGRRHRTGPRRSLARLPPGAPGAGDSGTGSSARLGRRGAAEGPDRKVPVAETVAELALQTADRVQVLGRPRVLVQG